MAKKNVEEVNYGKGCVLYVDGGCRPGYPQSETRDNRYGGWGFHGYTYNIGQHPPKLRTKKDVPTQAGYQIGEDVKLEEQVIPTGYVDAYGSMTTNDDSGKAELAGFKHAIDYVVKNAFNKVHVLMDNQYVIEGVKEGFDKWEALGWKKPDGGYYSNREAWSSIMNTFKPYQANNEFSISWVNGHSGNLGNDRADYLATKGVYKGRNGSLNTHTVLESPIAKYRDPKPEINRLFAKSRWYFNTQEHPLKSPDGRYVYHCGSHGPDDTLIGKAISDSVACVILTKEEMHVLESIRQHHRRLIPNPYNELCMARLDTILLPRVYDEIEQDGVDVLSLAPRRLRFEGLCTIDEQMVTKVIRPSGLTFKLIDTHNFMEHEIERYLENKATITDVTDAFYTEVEVKKKKEIIKTLEMHLSPATKIIRIPVNLGDGTVHKCALTIGIDAPPRELLKAIQHRLPKVYITTWKLSDAAFRYAMIFDLDDDLMMWMGKDSSMQLVYPEDMKKVS